MIRSFAVTLIALVMLGGLAVSVQANPTSTSGTLTGTGTSTPTATPGVFDSSFTGSGVDSVSGPFTGTNMGVITFTSPTTFVTSGTFVDVFPDGTVFGTFSGSGIETAGGNVNITYVTLITGGTGIFAGDTGKSTVTGTSTATSATTSSFTGSYTGIVTTPEPNPQTTYSYTGHAYNQFGGTFACPPVCGITGSFTVAAPLSPNQTFFSFTPLSFSFTDGLTTFTPLSVTGSVFQVVTNSFGQIIGWNMDWLTPGDEMFSSTNPPGCVGCRVVDGSFMPLGFAEIDNTPGNWSVSTSKGPFAYIGSAFSSSQLTVLDTSTNLVATTIAIPGFGGVPFGISPDQTHLYLANGNTVVVIDTTTNSLIGTISGVGPNANAVTIAPNGIFGYTANASADFTTGSVSVFSTATNSVVATVPVSFAAGNVTVTSDNALAYVSGTGSTLAVINTGTNTVQSTFSIPVPSGGFNGNFGPFLIPNHSFAYIGQAVTGVTPGTVTVIDIPSNQIVATILVGTDPNGMAFTPDGRYGYVANGGSNNVSVIDTSSNTVIATVPVGNQAATIAITPDGAFAYVGNLSDNTLSVIQISTNSVVATIPIPSPFGILIPSAAPASQPITQPLSPTAPNQFNFGPHNFTVTYPPGTSFSGVNMTVVAAQATQASIQQRLAGTPFANAACIVYSGAGGNCVDYQVTCSNTGGGQISCPSTSSPTITVKTSFDTLQSIINPGFLTTPIGTNNWTNIFDSFFLQRIDPTMKGRTSGFSEFVAVDLGATNNQGAGTFQFLAPLQSNDQRSFVMGASIPVEFQWAAVANPSVPVTDATAGITVVMISDANGNPTSKLVLEKSAAFTFGGGNYSYLLSTSGYAPGTYNITVYGNAFVGQQVEFTLTSPTGPRINTTLHSLTLNKTTKQYVAMYKISNTGGAAAKNLAVTASKLDSTATVTSLPASLGNLNPASSVNVTLLFPETAGAPNSSGEITISESYSGGTSGGGFRVTLP